MDKKQIDTAKEKLLIQSNISFKNISLIVINAKFLFAKEKLQENAWYFFKICINLKNRTGDPNTLEHKSTNWLKLREGLIELNATEFVYSDIDYADNLLEITVELMKEQSCKEPEIVRSRINLKNLNHGKEQEEYWNIGSLGVIGVKYKFYKEEFEKERQKIGSVGFNQDHKEENSLNIFYDNKIKHETDNDHKELAHEILNQFQKSMLNNVTIDEEEYMAEFNKSNDYTDSQKIEDLRKRKLPFILESEEAREYQLQISKGKNTITRYNSESELAHGLNKELNKNNLHKNSRSNSLSGSSQFLNNNLVILENQILEISKHYLESLCEAFFVAGVSQKNAVRINESECYISPCRHKKCSILPAYRPEILQRFVMGEVIGGDLNDKCKSNYLDLTAATSSLCFPQGIKLCYNQLESEIRPIKNFTTISTNEYGTRFYIFMCHYYVKTDCISFKKLYEFDPVKEYFHQTIFSNTDNLSLNKKQSEKIEKNLELFTEFINCDYIYIPQCISLVSKIPFTKQIQKCAETILKMSVDSSFESGDINKLLLHLIYEVPIPPPNKRLLFYLPYQTSPTEISGNLFKDLPIFSTPSTILLDYFSAEAIVSIYNMILLEQKLLFIHDDYSILTEISQAFLNIIYPIQWISTYIPVLSEEMIKYVQLSFMPYIMGIDETMLKLQAKAYFEDDNNIFLIFIKKGVVTTSVDYCKNKTGANIKSVSRNLPQLPDEVQEELIKEIKNIQITKGKETRFICHKEKKISVNDSENNSFNNSAYNSNMSSTAVVSSKVEKMFRNLFIKTMVTLYGDYRNYTSLVRENVPCFTSDIFLLNRPEKYSNFFNEFIQTGNFKNFLRLPRENFPHFEKMCKRFNNTIMNRNNKKLKTLNLSESKKKMTVKFVRNASSLKTIKENSSPIRTVNKTGTIMIKSKLDTKENMFNSEANIKTDEFQKQNEILKTPIKKNSSNIRSNKSFYDGSSESNPNIENFNKSQENIESFLITPFFINNPIIKLDVAKIEDFLHEKFKYANHPLCDNERLDTESSISKCKNYTKCNKCTKCKFDLIKENGIVSNAKEFSVQKILQEIENFSRYIIPGNESDLNNVNTNRRKSSGGAYVSNLPYMTNPLEEENKSHIENIINTIDEYLRSIFSSTPLSLNDKTNIQTILNTKYGRHCFSEILYQKKFRDNVSQILNDKGFDDLAQIIFSSLLLGENENSQFDDMIRITKSCFYYYKLNKNKDYLFLFSEITKKQGCNFNIWLNDEFWLRWFELELIEKENKFSSMDDFYFTLLIKIASIMEDLHIDINKIFSCVVDKIGISYINKNPVLIKELQEFLKRHNRSKIKERKENDIII